MKNSFQGFWATFEYLDDFCRAITDLKKKGFGDITTHSPCPRHEITHALHDTPSRVPFFTLLFGLLGTTLGFVVATWMNLDWVLPVSNKPIISIPAFIVIMFEMTILLGSYGTALGVIFFSIRSTKKKKFPVDERYKSYDRFSVDRFGLVVRCKEEHFDDIQTILTKHHGEEIYSEK